ncbi:MAG: glycogen synthase [Chthonomonas sp.]|nr:glycogen synthase [Chthonomonas sp.]
MKILFVSVEVAPWAKVGGLADVAGSLPQALRELGHDVRVLMPAYGMVVQGKKPVKTFTVKVNPETTYRASLYEIEGVWMVNCPEFFGSAMRSEEVYAYGRDAYLFLSQAAIELCEGEDWIPDVVHANDWHTGFTPVMIREKAGSKWDRTATIFTIHNLLYQGTFGADTITAAGLDESLFTMDKLETWGGVNFIKSASVFADMVNTVSPTYAKEIQTEEYGASLWGLMRDLAQLGKLRGILNGIHYEFFNPETDPAIAANFSADDLIGKSECKKALQFELGLPQSDSPILGIVSRLSDQKGFDLIVKQAYGMLGLGVQFIALGTGDPWAAEQLRQLEDEWPDQVRFIERYDAPLAQRIYAGSDMFLMPSAFEPCGLGQMIACRYGTVPIVRETGGLADSIHDEQNGLVFMQKSARELLKTIWRGVELYEDKAKWAEFVKRCMTTDFSWDKSAKEYVAMYEDALNARLGSMVVSR